MNINRRAFLASSLAFFSFTFETRASRAELSARIESSLGCENFRDLFWNSVYAEVEKSTSALYAPFNAQNFDMLSDDPIVARAGIEIMNLIFSETPSSLKLKNEAQLLEALTAMELGDQSTSAKKKLYAKAEKLLKIIQGRSEKLGLRCANEEEDVIQRKSQVSIFANPMSAADGAFKTFSTFFQSCEVMDLPLLKSTQPNMKGISITGTHADGIGSKRVVSSVSQVVASNPYLSKITRFETGCQNVKTNPPIYDYGGKPYATSDINSTLDFFKNAGSGTSAMGIDCSGLVFTALATAGLKLKKSTALKAISVGGVSASMFANPAGNGLDCLERVSFDTTSSVQPGDIIARPGHVIIVDSVGSDPFGLAKITKVADCTSAKLPSSKYNFNVLQSASMKGGLGVNRIPASEYVKVTTSWASGINFYAIKACKAKFGTKSNAAYSDGLAFVRHKNTAECKAARVLLTKEACVKTCSTGG